MYRTVRSLPAVRSNQGLAAEKTKEAARTSAPYLFSEGTDARQVGRGIEKKKMYG